MGPRIHYEIGVRIFAWRYPSDEQSASDGSYSIPSSELITIHIGFSRGADTVRALSGLI